MNREFLNLYEEELGHVRETAAEFGVRYPKIAGRLRLRHDGCEDPFVERMIEGFAFLAARVRAKLDAEYPVFCQSLLETVYPQLLAPVPSMTVVQFQPDPNLDGVFTVEAGTTLTGHLGTNEDTRCEFRTSHEVNLMPVRIDVSEETRYHYRDLDRLRLPSDIPAKAAIRLRVEHAQADKTIAGLGKLGELTFFLTGPVDEAGAIYEELLERTTHVALRPVANGVPGRQWVTHAIVEGGLRLEPVGFAPGEALLPPDARTFDGYRLLREYSAMPQRLLFVRLTGPALQEFAAACDAAAFDVAFVFDRQRANLGRLISRGRLVLHATPVVNLFSRRTDQVILEERFAEHQVVVDRSKPLSYEVFQVMKVSGVVAGRDQRLEFQPFYRCQSDGDLHPEAFFSVRREPRRLTGFELRHGRRSEYLGSEVYLSLVDRAARVLRGEFGAVSVTALCSNRHLPLTMPVGSRETDFFPPAGMPVSSVKCLVPLTRPLRGLAETETGWRLISHLSLNYLSLTEGEHGAAALREILTIYQVEHGEDALHWTGGVSSVSARPVVRRHPGTSPVAFVRGLRVKLGLDEGVLAGTSAYLLGAVLARFLAGHTSINSFVETVVETEQRGQIGCWAGIPGTRHVL